MRSKPAVMALRATRKQKGSAEALAEMRGLSVSELMHSRLFPWVIEELTKELNAEAGALAADRVSQAPGA